MVFINHNLKKLLKSEKNLFFILNAILVCHYLQDIEFYIFYKKLICTIFIFIYECLPLLILFYFSLLFNLYKNIHPNIRFYNNYFLTKDIIPNNKNIIFRKFSFNFFYIREPKSKFTFWFTLKGYKLTKKKNFPVYYNIFFKTCLLKDRILFNKQLLKKTLRTIFYFIIYVFTTIHKRIVKIFCPLIGLDHLSNKLYFILIVIFNLVLKKNNYLIIKFFMKKKIQRKLNLIFFESFLRKNLLAQSDFKPTFFKKKKGGFRFKKDNYLTIKLIMKKVFFFIINFIYLSFIILRKVIWILTLLFYLFCILSFLNIYIDFYLLNLNN